MGGGRKPPKMMTHYSENATRARLGEKLTKIANDILTDTAINLAIHFISSVNPPLGAGLLLLKEAYDFYEKVAEEKQEGAPMHESLVNASVRYVSSKIVGETTASVTDSVIEHKVLSEFIRASITEFVKSGSGNLADRASKYLLEKVKEDAG